VQVVAYELSALCAFVAKERTAKSRPVKIIVRLDILGN